MLDQLSNSTRQGSVVVVILRVISQHIDAAGVPVDSSPALGEHARTLTVFCGLPGCCETGETGSNYNDVTLAPGSSGWTFSGNGYAWFDLFF